MPAIVPQEIFELVQEKPSRNRKHSPRNNKSHRYLLRRLVGCGACKQGSNARTTPGMGAATTSAGGTTRLSRSAGAGRGMCRPSNGMSWSGKTSAKCSPIRSASETRWRGHTEDDGYPKSSRRG